MAFGSLSVKGRALRHLAQREYSRAELERKLARHVEDTAEASAQAQITAVLDDLGAHGLISDARVAEYVLAGQASRCGSRRLQQTLRARGLAPALVASTLQQARGTELERACKLWRRRFGSPPTNPAERARQVRFLLGRGFEGELIRRVVRGVEEDPDL